MAADDPKFKLGYSKMGEEKDILTAGPQNKINFKRIIFVRKQISSKASALFDAE